VIVGLVFVLGVMVGRRVEARGHIDRARVAATVDPLAALDRLEGGSGLSFQGALRGADAPVSDVEKEIAKKASGLKPQASAGHQASGSSDAKAEMKADAPKKDEPKADAKKDEPKADAKKDEPKTDAKKDEPKAEAKKVDAKADAKKEEPKKDDAKADAKKEEPKKDDAKAEAKKEEPKADVKKDEPKKEPKYTLQLSSFQDKGEAQAYLESIKGTGVSAHIVEGSVDGKQYFRVRTGSYKTMDAANQARADLEKSTKKSAIVIKL
jgi:cell division protein FtsN